MTRENPAHEPALIACEAEVDAFYEEMAKKYDNLEKNGLLGR